MSFTNRVFSHRWRIAIVGSLLAVVWLLASASRPALAQQHPFPGSGPAPALEGGIGWLNVGGPIDLKELRGKWVILDFWTYCCINCQHVLPELRRLEKAYPNEVVVIGVHSGKFTGEGDLQNIEEAILRHDIRHPVVNDANMAIWRTYEVNSWPTLCVIDPEGNLVIRQSGETQFDTLDKFLKEKTPYYKRMGKLDVTPLRFELATFKAAETPLRFPGKILADEDGDRLFISDSSHNRIVITNLAGKLIDVIGTGQVGKLNGPASRATFDHPQGMALDSARNILYVADTENHLIRQVDLKGRMRMVTTIAGTGNQLHGWPNSEVPIRTELSSPWALELVDSDLYIAMAGPHQIWKMSLANPREIRPFAGNGREDIVDGPRLPGAPYALGSSSFAQPSGLSFDGDFLYVADSEGSSIRAVPLDARNVSTVVGTSMMPAGRLFTFGDADGVAELARLQHPLDVLYHEGLLFVADTYNNKIKVIDPMTALCKTFAGTGASGKSDLPVQFNEPSGLAFANGKLYVADTNNHLIRTIDMMNGNEVSTLKITGLSPPEPAKVAAGSQFPGATVVDLAAANLKPVDGKLKLQVALALPLGFKIDPQAPMQYQIDSDNPSGPVARDSIGKLTTPDPKKAEFEIELPTSAISGKERLSVSLVFHYCSTASQGVCKIGTVIWHLPLTVAADGSSESAKLPFKAN